MANEYYGLFLIPVFVQLIRHVQFRDEDNRSLLNARLWGMNRKAWLSWPKEWGGIFSRAPEGRTTRDEYHGVSLITGQWWINFTACPIFARMIVHKYHAVFPCA